MSEDINFILNFIKENNLIPLILPIALPFIYIHFVMKFIYLFTRSIKSSNFQKEKKQENVKYDIPVELKKEMVLSNENFIKF